MHPTQSFFAPELFVRLVAPAMDYYNRAFGATVLRQWNNEDGTVHVAEMSLQGALFHIHEETPNKNRLSPESLKGTGVVIGLFVEDVHKVMASALAAGGKELSPVTDYEYKYRQGIIEDPFGHQWQIQKSIE